MTYIDTNVLIDLIDDQSEAHQGCLEKFMEAQASGPVLLSDIAYSEASVGMASKEELDAVVAGLGLARRRANDDALFRAGRAYKEYRNTNNGPKNNVLPDFLIGAQAVVEGSALITSDTKRMVGYFPELNVVQP